jgi:glycosyltransferase involved in cell wall biosynthesis
MSRDEGFPTATIEAMYCGVPVITSDIPQFKEQVDEGLNGFTVSLGDTNKLAETIQKMIEIDRDSYASLQEESSKKFKELSLQNVCKELYSIYKNLEKSA